MSEENDTLVEAPEALHDAGDPPAAVDEQLGEAPEREPEEVQMALPLLQLELSGAPVDVMKGPDGERALLVGPVLIRFVMPLGGEAARNIARELTGGLDLATTLTPADRAAAERIIRV
jgi:hypothetical protein